MILWEELRVKALILHWSIFGTTRQIAETIAQGLHDEGVECELRDLRQGVPSDVADYDVIGIGFPVAQQPERHPLRAAADRDR